MNQNHPPEASVHTPEVQRDIDRREQARAEELEHLGDLRKRIERGIDEGRIEEIAGAEMLLNISKARMALSGVGSSAVLGAW